MRFLRMPLFPAALALPLLIVATTLLATAPSAQAVECTTDALNLLLQNDGAVGMYLKRVNGPVLAGFNESTVFEPASAIKVLVHAYGLRQVQDGVLTLDTGIDWTRDLSEDVCGSHPCNVQTPQAENDPLSLLLMQMMQCSDNRHTHALRTLFGDNVLIAAGASEFGMTDTDFNHIIGCPDCDSLNEITLVDIGRIYEGVATGYLDEEHQALFHDLMLNETNSGLGNIFTVIDQEVANAGKSTDVADAFKAQVRYMTKGGSYRFSTGCSADEDSLYRSLGGLIELPINNGAAVCEYVFGAWINEAPSIAQGTGTVASELLRLAVCEALQTWDMIDVDEMTAVIDPPNPWGMEIVHVEEFEVTAGTDLLNLRFFADPLQCKDVHCEASDVVKKISSSQIEFVPQEIAYVPANTTVTVEVKKTIPIGQHACTYEAQIHAVADVEGLCVPVVSETIDCTVVVEPEEDLDIDDNQGHVSGGVLRLKGSKGNTVSATFTLVNPNSWDQNVDFDDGPGNIRLNPVQLILGNFVKIGDPAVTFPGGTVLPNLSSLASGEARKHTLTVQIPDGIPVNAVYTTTLGVQYQSCLGGGFVSDAIDVELEVLPTQGTLDIVETELVEEFCPPDPWTMVGQVLMTFTIEANGDHRNIRVASGGLRHETMDKKLDEFNFFPEEIAFLAAGETRTITVITKIPIGQHSGVYDDYFRIVSESAGEDSVHAEITICPIFDLDIEDDYGHLAGNVMEIQAIAKANASGGEWALRAFDIGLPGGLINNHDGSDGPGNTPVDCIECEFAEWSPQWHEEGQEFQFKSDFFFTGEASLTGDLCTVGAGEFRRTLVSLFVPPMKPKENHPGLYKGRLDCWAVASGDTVSHDYFDIEVRLARDVGSPGNNATAGSFGGGPTPEGVEMYWGSFTTLGFQGPVNLYKQDPAGGEFRRVNGSSFPQNSRYVDTDVEPGEIYTYRLGVLKQGRETLIGPLHVGRNPQSFLLAQNAPNPVSDQTTIAFRLPEAARVALRIYDVNGRLVRSLLDTDERPAGFYSATWDRTDESGRIAAAGIYFYRLEAGEHSSTRKLVLIP